MTRSSATRIRFWTALGALTTAAGVVASTGVGHAAPDTCLPSGAGSVTCTYEPSDGLVRFVVPDRVTWLDITAAGGAGGESFGATGGRGARIHNAAVAVTTGDTLFLRSGWSGADSGRGGARGGMGGVRNAGSGGNGGVEGAAGGGGASEVYDRTSGRSLLIAGGGGGAGGDGGGAGIPMFGGLGGDAGSGGGEGNGQRSGEGGSAPSAGINRSLVGPAGHAGTNGGAGGGGGGGGAGVGGAATGASDGLGSGGGGAGGGSFGAGATQGDAGLSAEHDGSIVIRYTPGAPAPNATPNAVPATPTAPAAGTPTPSATPSASPSAPAQPTPEPTAASACTLSGSAERATCAAATESTAPTPAGPTQP